MKRFDLPLIADTVFYAAAAAFLSLGLLRYFRVPLPLSFALAALFAAAAGGLVFLLLFTRSTRRRLSGREAEGRDALMLHLALERGERVQTQLLEALTADGKRAHCKENTLLVEDVPCIPLFTLQPVSADEIARLLREYRDAPFLVACNALSPEAERLLARFSRRAVRADEVYALFARTNTVPEPLICGELPQRTAKLRLRRAFSKRNARPFFTSGLLLLLMSLFTFFPLYYLISGSVLTVLSVFVRAFGVREGETSR